MKNHLVVINLFSKLNALFISEKFISFYFFINGFLANFIMSFASIAQLVEQRFRKAWVAGSSPVGGSKYFLDSCIF